MLQWVLCMQTMGLYVQLQTVDTAIWSEAVINPQIPSDAHHLVVFCKVNFFFPIFINQLSKE